MRTIPSSDRPLRPNEVDYKFMSNEELLAMERSVASDVAILEGRIFPGAQYSPYTDRLRSAAVAAYTYNPFIGSSNHNPSLAPPPSHLSRPSSSLRLEDSLFLERYGKVRPGSSFHEVANLPVIPRGELSQASSGSFSTTFPSYRFTPRYSELLATHQERVLNEERDRLLGYSLASSSSSSSSATSPAHRNKPTLVNVPNYKIRPPLCTNNLTPSDGSSDLRKEGSIIHLSPRETPHAGVSVIGRKPNGSIIPVPNSSPSSHIAQKPSPNLNAIKHLDLGCKNPLEMNLIQPSKNLSSHQINHPIASTNSFTSSSQPVPLLMVSPRSSTTSSSIPSIPSNSNHNGSVWQPQTGEFKTHAERLASKLRYSAESVSKRLNSSEAPIDYSSSKKSKIDESYKESNFDLSSSHKLVSESNAFIPISPPNRSADPSSPILQPIKPEKPKAITPQSANNQIQVDKNSINCSSSDHATDQVISKIDLMIMKLKSKRFAWAENHSNSDEIDEFDENFFSLTEDEEDIDSCSSDENKPSKINERIIITKGPPLKLDTSRDKLNFLTSLGLVTHKKKQELEFEKFNSDFERRRQKRLALERMESSLESVPNNLSNVDDKSSLEPSKILPSTLTPRKTDPKSDEKLAFMSQLGLRFENNVSRIKECELEWQGVLQERERRKSLNLCFSKTLNNLTEEALNEWLESLSRIVRPTNGRNGLVNELNHRSKFASHQSNLQRRLIPFSTRNGKISITSDTAHGSVQTETRDKITPETVSIERSLICKPPGSFEADRLLDQSNNLKWPGVEAIIDSYKRYLLEIHDTKKGLIDKLQSLKSISKSKKLLAESSRQRMEATLIKKRELENDNDRIKKETESLKGIFQQILH
ncbi:uncharacterized protein LOC141854348 [Brevipalpus obovatus]|uniref:uncharacterized protein LOC141854348 n=1 Tax=Brevipalpus obovatus TaxID=246614 RepID=UPI003D9E2517